MLLASDLADTFRINIYTDRHWLVNVSSPPRLAREAARDRGYVVMCWGFSDFVKRHRQYLNAFGVGQSVRCRRLASRDKRYT